MNRPDDFNYKAERGLPKTQKVKEDILTPQFYEGVRFVPPTDDPCLDALS